MKINLLKHKGRPGRLLIISFIVCFLITVFVAPVSAPCVGCVGLPTDPPCCSASSGGSSTASSGGMGDVTSGGNTHVGTIIPGGLYYVGDGYYAWVSGDQKTLITFNFLDDYKVEKIEAVEIVDGSSEVNDGEDESSTDDSSDEISNTLYSLDGKEIGYQTTTTSYDKDGNKVTTETLNYNGGDSTITKTTSYDFFGGHIDISNTYDSQGNLLFSDRSVVGSDGKVLEQTKLFDYTKTNTAEDKQGSETFSIYTKEPDEATIQYLTGDDPSILDVQGDGGAGEETLTLDVNNGNDDTGLDATTGDSGLDTSNIDSQGEDPFTFGSNGVDQPEAGSYFPGLELRKDPETGEEGWYNIKTGVKIEHPQSVPIPLGGIGSDSSDTQTKMDSEYGIVGGESTINDVSLNDDPQADDKTATYTIQDEDDQPADIYLPDGDLANDDSSGTSTEATQYDYQTQYYVDDDENQPTTTVNNVKTERKTTYDDDGEVNGAVEYTTRTNSAGKEETRADFYDIGGELISYSVTVPGESSMTKSSSITKSYTPDGKLLSTTIRTFIPDSHGYSIVQEITDSSGNEKKIERSYDSGRHLIIKSETTYSTFFGGRIETTTDTSAAGIPLSLTTTVVGSDGKVLSKIVTDPSVNIVSKSSGEVVTQSGRWNSGLGESGTVNSLKNPTSGYVAQVMVE